MRTGKIDTAFWVRVLAGDFPLDCRGQGDWERRRLGTIRSKPRALTFSREDLQVLTTDEILAMSGKGMNPDKRAATAASGVRVAQSRQEKTQRVETGPSEESRTTDPR